jgi:hypothetical protein
MCQPPGGETNPQSLEQGLGLIRAILAGHAGDGLAPLPPMGQGAAGMAAPPANGNVPSANGNVPPANRNVGLPQPSGTVPSPELGLSFLTPTAPAPDPTTMTPQPSPPRPQDGPGLAGLPTAAGPPPGGISICLHLSPETVAALMGAVMHLLGGGAQMPANPAPPPGFGGPAAPVPGAADQPPGHCPGA